MSRLIDTDGLSRVALKEVYEIVLMQKLVLEAKLERIQGEMAIASCAIDDGEIDAAKISHGLKNLIAYIESNNNVADELDVTQGSIDLVNIHLKRIKDYEENRRAGKTIMPKLVPEL